MWRSRAREDRLDQELRDHVERFVAAYVAQGLSESDARRRARLELGGFQQAKERCRDVRPWQWLEELRRDVRIGWRALARERLLAMSVVFILTIGIGASVAMFSVLTAVVLRPLPYARPSELTMLTTRLMAQNRPDGSSIPNIVDWGRESRSFAGFTFFRRTAVSTVTFAGPDAPQRALEGLVGPNFFELLGAAPVVGRTFTPGEFDRREAVVVISEGLWQEQFGRSPSIVGRTLQIDGVSHTVLGVLPQTFQLPTRDTRFWRPASLLAGWEGSRTARDGDGYEVLGRLAPGARLDEARAEMQVIAARLRESYPTNENLDVSIQPLFEHVVGDRTRRGVWLGFAAVLSLLAIACANVGGLMSVRSARRRRELALRSALGAGRGRLIRQLLAENVGLWAVASVAGITLAAWLVQLLAAYGPAFPRMEDIRIDAAATAAALILGLVATCCGTIPSLISAQDDGASAFTVRHLSGLPRQRLQDWLVTAQVAGALALLVAALLFARSFARADGEDPGYPAANLLVVRLDLPRTTYPDAPALATFFREARARISSLPGVVAVGGMTDFFIRRNADQSVTVEGRPLEPPAQKPRLAIESVTPGYFASAGIEIVSGREFDERDFHPSASRVFIINEVLAERFWPGEDPLGKRMVSGSLPRTDGRWDTVVGVVRDMRREGLDRAPIATAFTPSYLRGMDLSIRTLPGAGDLRPAVRQAIQSIDSSLAVGPVNAVADRLSERLAERRFEAQALGIFALVAVVLSAAGLYASLAYRVTVRTREIGIRQALGADRRWIVGMILGDGVRSVIAGTTIGVVAAVSTGQFLRSLLYETSALDPGSYVAAAAGVVAVAAMAAAIPALRATRINPIVALRED